MIYYLTMFVILAVIAAVLAFGGVAGALAGISQGLFYAFLTLLVLSLAAGLIQKIHH